KQVGIAPHERDVLLIGHNESSIRSTEQASATSSLGPMQHARSGEMTSAPDQRHIRKQLKGFAFPQLDLCVGAHDPVPVVGVDMDRNIESATPIRHARME